MHCSTDGGQGVRGGKWRMKGKRGAAGRALQGYLALRWLPLSFSSLTALPFLWTWIITSLAFPAVPTLALPPLSPPALNPYRSRPRYRHGAGVAAPSLRRLPVLFVGSFEHLLHVSDLVLAHRRHVHVAPERQRWGRRRGGGRERESLLVKP